MKTKRAQAFAFENLAINSSFHQERDSTTGSDRIFIDQNEESGPGVRLKDPI
jgi:hypothetical protein